MPPRHAPTLPIWEIRPCGHDRQNFWCFILLISETAGGGALISQAPHFLTQTKSALFVLNFPRIRCPVQAFCYFWLYFLVVTLNMWVGRGWGGGAGWDLFQCGGWSGAVPPENYSYRNGAQIIHFEEFWSETMVSVKKLPIGRGEALCPLDANVEEAPYKSLQLNWCSVTHIPPPLFPDFPYILILLRGGSPWAGGGGAGARA